MGIGASAPRLWWGVVMLSTQFSQIKRSVEPGGEGGTGGEPAWLPASPGMPKRSEHPSGGQEGSAALRIGDRTAQHQ